MAEIIMDEDIDLIRIEKVKKAPEPSHYIDNKKLSAAMIEWRKLCDAAKAAGQERPRIPEYVGKSILDMSRSLGKRFNFRNYSWLDEMISDAVLHACKYIHNFDPFAKTKTGVPSAFSYINRILWRSFTHRIELEDKNQYLKNKSFELLGGMDAFKDSDMEEANGGDGDAGGGATISVIGEELLRRAYEYEEKHGLGLKKLKNDPAVVENDMLLSFMDPDPVDPDLEEDEPEVDPLDIIFEED